MCGIIYQRGGNASNEILDQYKRQRDRGTDGFGFLVINGTTKRYRFRTEAETFYQLGQVQDKEILFHHRFPTSTGNNSSQNHPIKTSQYKKDYYLIHNGIIGNASELFQKHTKAGKTYETLATYEGIVAGIASQRTEFNDSESLLHELAGFIEGKTGEINASGSIAFIMLQTEKSGKPLRLYYGRNEGNPLKIRTKKGVTRIASELKKGEMIPANVLFFYDYATGETKKISQSIGIYQPISYSTGLQAHGGAYGDYYDDDYGMPPFKATDGVMKNEFDYALNELIDRAYTLYESFDVAGLESLAKEAEEIADVYAEELSDSQVQAIDGFVSDVGGYVAEIERIEKVGA